MVLVHQSHPTPHPEPNTSDVDSDLGDLGGDPRSREEARDGLTVYRGVRTCENV